MRALILRPQNNYHGTELVIGFNRIYIVVAFLFLGSNSVVAGINELNQLKTTEKGNVGRHRLLTKPLR